MNDKNFGYLINQLNKYSKKYPQRYKLQVGFLAILGHLFLLTIFVLSILLLIRIGLLFWYFEITKGLFILAIILLTLISIILLTIFSVIFSEIPAPQGIILNKKQVPELFNLLEDLINQLKSLRLNRIILDNSYSTFVMQIPSMGLIGKNRNYLIIGLPLLFAVSPLEFKAILAHELGHLSSNHSLFRGWIYRSRLVWESILDRLKQKLEQNQSSGLSWFLLLFYYWYIPYFNAYSFVLARQDEYEADNCAGKIIGKEQMASALVNLQVKDYYLKLLWSKIDEQMKDKPTPPLDIFNYLALFFKQEFDPLQTQELLKKALKKETDLIDTHPCLKERLEKLKISPQKFASFLGYKKQNAAEKYLGNCLDQFIAKFNEDWYKSRKYEWKIRYDQNHRKVEKYLVDLTKKDDTEDLTIEETWLKAKLTFYHHSKEEALPLIESLLEKQENHGGANCLLGFILLDQNEEKGIEHIKKSFNFDPFLAMEGCEVISKFLLEKNKPEEAEIYIQKVKEIKKILPFSEYERSNIFPDDQFINHQLPASEIDNFAQQFNRYLRIEAVYLVQKVFKYFSDPPFYLLGIKTIQYYGFLKNDIERKKNSLLLSIEKKVSLPRKTMIIIFEHNNQSKLSKSIIEVATNPVFSRN